MFNPFLFSGNVKRKKECCLNMVIKPLGKNVGCFSLQICDLTSLDDGEHFYGGYMRSLRYSQKCTFQSFVAFLRKDGTKMKRKPGDENVNHKF